MAVVMNLLLWLGFTVLVAGLTGGIHPAGDSAAVFRAPVAVAMLVLWVLRRPAFGWGWVPGGMALLALVGVLLQSFPGGAAGPVTLYQRNLLHTNAAAEEIAEDIRIRAPDIVTLQELSDKNAALLEMLRDQYPHQQACPFAGWNGIAVLSRHPFAPGSQQCSQRRTFAAAQIAAPQGAFWLYSVHLYWPWPHRQAAQRETLIAALDQHDGPVVLAGDFNMVPWSRTLHALRAVTGTRLAGPIRATRRLMGLPLPIDHVLAPGGGRLTRLEHMGSDHAGLWAEIGV